MNVAFSSSIAYDCFLTFLGEVWGQIEIKVHLSPALQKKIEHDQFSLKVLSYQVKPLLSWVGEWLGQIKIKDHLSPAEAEIRAELGNIF